MMTERRRGELMKWYVVRRRAMIATATPFKRLGNLMRIILSAVDDRLADAWEAHCGDLDCVEIHRGNILNLNVDSVVSPANSYGFMDGGIDQVFSNYFGWNIQNRLQEKIRANHNGELLVGNAEIVETGDSRIEYLIAAPTMRVPMVLSDTVHPYLAARAALLLVKCGTFSSGDLVGERIFDVVKSIAFPGLGTGVGRVPPETCALQVRAALEHVILDRYEYPASWADAQIRHQKLYTDRIRDLQF